MSAKSVMIKERTAIPIKILRPTLVFKEMLYLTAPVAVCLMVWYRYRPVKKKITAGAVPTPYCIIMNKSKS